MKSDNIIDDEICEYCQRRINRDEQVYVFRHKIACYECDKKLRNPNEMETDEKEVFVVIRKVWNIHGKEKISGIDEKLKVSKQCIYCDNFREPNFSKQTGFCGHAESSPRFDGSCNLFKPNSRSSWWLQEEGMMGNSPGVNVWWTTYSDKAREEREMRKDQNHPVQAPEIKVELTTMWSIEKPHLRNICLSSDGRYIAAQYASSSTLSERQANKSSIIGIWDIQQQRQRNEIMVGESKWNLCLSPDMKFLAATALNEEMFIWNLNTGTMQNSVKVRSVCWFNGLAFLNISQFLIAASGSELIAWDYTRSTNVQKITKINADISCLSVNADGKLFAAGTEENMIHIFDTDTWQEIRTLSHAGNKLRSVRLHPQQHIIATATEGEYHFETVSRKSQKIKDKEGQIVIWNIDVGKKLRDFPCRGQVSFNATGQLLVGDTDKGLAIWDVSSGGKVGSMHMEQESSFCLASNADILAITKSNSSEGMGKCKLIRISIF